MCDPKLSTSQLTLPKDVILAAKPAENPRLASAGTGTVIGLAFVGALVTGGLWLTRRANGRQVVAILVPLLGLALLGASVEAQPTAEPLRRIVIHRGKIQISRNAAGGHGQLVLPPRKFEDGPSK